MTAPADSSARHCSRPAGATDKASVEALIREIWPDELEERALTIARRESGLNPNVHKGWLSTIGVTSAAQLLDPRVNATAALTLYVRNGGWGPWE